MAVTETKLQIRIDKDLKERIQKQADKLGISLSAYVKMTISKALERDERTR